jgi:outer membrane receptor protein involved in Fe transport
MKVSAPRNMGSRFALTAMASALAGFSALGMSATALAQDTAASAGESGSSGLEEVVVYARRTGENLQDIPVSVQAITGREIQDLLMTQPSDISSLAAGLDIALDSPTDAVVSLRGVRWTPGSGTPATPIYLNEISFDTAALIQTMYDLSQIEVLRGPQGTARGAPSISGAVTLTTKRPDLEEMGGYLSGIAGEHDRRNAQGAISIPVIDGKLAVRLAGSYDQTQVNRVKSLSNPKSPELENKSVRASLRWAPTDTILIDAMYQRLEQDGKYYTAVAGPGAPGLPAPPIVPENYNGPAISSGQNIGVAPGYNSVDDTVEYYTVNASWDVFDNYTINYNFGDQHTTGGSATDRNKTNILPGFTEGRNRQKVEDPKYYVHEARFSSIRGSDRFYDFDLGYYYQKFDGVSVFSQDLFLDGAFGSPLDTYPGQLTSPNTRYNLQINGRFTIARTLESFYGNVEFHLTDDTELTVGVRSIDDKDNNPSTIDFVPVQDEAFQAFLSPIANFDCQGLAGLSPDAGVIDSPVYGDPVCEAPAPPIDPIYESASNKNSETIYNISLSHRFSDEVLAYATTGTSYRGGLPALFNPGLPQEYLDTDPETATSYEIGVKTNWSDWLVVNADVFLIDYKDQLTQFQATPYYNGITGEIGSTSVAFFRNLDAQVIGGEIEISAAPIDNLVLNTYLSYSAIESEGGSVPCIDDSRPLGPDNIMNFCELEDGKNINATPKFQASFLGNYIVPLGAFDGYLRTLVSYQDENPNYGASLEETDAYATVDVFVGLTGKDGGWDVGLYAKNVFDKQEQLSRQLEVNAIYPPFGDNGYDIVNMTLPREVGMTVQYAFGSR